MTMFRNAQWAVTKFGLEAIKPAPTYEIQADRLVETTERGDATFYDWPVHMAEKSWVNIDLFNEAFSEALKAHQDKCDPAVDEAMLEASFFEARAIANEG